MPQVKKNELQWGGDGGSLNPATGGANFSRKEHEPPMGASVTRARALLEYACRWDPHGKSTKIVSLLIDLGLLRHVFGSS